MREAYLTDMKGKTSVKQGNVTIGECTMGRKSTELGNVTIIGER